MTPLTILLELEPATEVVDPASGEVDIGARVLTVHAAATPASSQTLCGHPTFDLEPEPYAPGGPDAPWYPPDHATRRCPHCDAALRSAAA